MKIPIAIFALAGLVFSQELTREGPYWVRVTERSISGPLPPHIQVSGRAHIVMRGAPGEQITYKLTQRVRVASPTVARSLMGTAVATRYFDLARLAIESASSVANDLEISLPSQISTAALESQFGDLEAYDFAGAVQA